MIGGVIIEAGWCGFGCDGGLFPELRLGCVRVCCYRGSFIDRISRLVTPARDRWLELCGLLPAAEATRAGGVSSLNCAGDQASPAAFSEDT